MQSNELWTSIFQNIPTRSQPGVQEAKKLARPLVWVYRRGRSRIFFGGGALVSCSTSTPINHIVFFLQNTSCIRKLQVISGGGEGVRTPCTLPLDPPLYPHFLLTGNCSGSSLISSSLACSPEVSCSFSVSCLTDCLSVTPCTCNPWGRVGSATECVVRGKERSWDLVDGAPCW